MSVSTPTMHRIPILRHIHDPPPCNFIQNPPCYFALIAGSNMTFEIIQSFGSCPTYFTSEVVPDTLEPKVVLFCQLKHGVTVCLLAYYLGLRDRA